MTPRSGSRGWGAGVESTRTRGQSGQPMAGSICRRHRGMADRRPASQSSLGVPGLMDQTTDRSAARRSKRRRALFAVLLGASFATLGAGAMSLAIFTDSDAYDGTWTSGTIILGVTSTTAFTVDDILPGDTGNKTIQVNNTGTGALRYAMTSTADNTDTKNLRSQLTPDDPARHVRGSGRGHLHRPAQRRQLRRPRPGRRHRRPHRRLRRRGQPVLQLGVRHQRRQRLPGRHDHGDVHLRSPSRRPTTRNPRATRAPARHPAGRGRIRHHR